VEHTFRDHLILEYEIRKYDDDFGHRSIMRLGAWNAMHPEARPKLSVANWFCEAMERKHLEWSWD
jgi:hypothetical protein